MAEWTVVLVLVVLVGLFLSVGAPIIKLNSNLTTLNVKLEHMQSENAEYKQRNTESHARIFDRLDDDEKTIGLHETRLTVLEKK